MVTTGDKTPREWFDEAARCYIEGHQGCAWCGGAYRVFHHKRDRKQVYYCQGCDFQVGQDERTGTCFVVPGTSADRRGQDTMLVADQETSHLGR